MQPRLTVTSAICRVLWRVYWLYKNKFKAKINYKRISTKPESQTQKTVVKRKPLIILKMFVLINLEGYCDTAYYSKALEQQKPNKES